MPPSKKRKRRSPKSRRKTKKSFVIKSLILLILIPVVAVTAFLIHYYYVFDGNIEMKLGKRNPLSEIRIYSAPDVLYPGKNLSLTQLATGIRKLGYYERSRNRSGSYYRILGSNHLLICNGGAVPADASRRVDIIFSGNSIHSIHDQGTGREVSRFSLQPALLSNAIDQKREKRRRVGYNDLPQSLVNAVLAMEDRRFFSHSGIDPVRIIRALVVDLRQGDAAQGASTLTQQFVKNYFLTPERTWRRKFADAYMSVLLEQRLSKKEIFELYCNEVYLGQIGSFSIVGFGQAADAFFGKNVRDLTPGESATLVGIIPAPNRFTPLRYRDKALTRRNLVLDRMCEYEMISPGERDREKSRPLVVRQTSIMNYSDAPYFVDYVQKHLGNGYAELSGSGVRIYTTLDQGLQQAAFESVQSGLAAIDEELATRRKPVRRGTVQASLIAVDPRTGYVLAMVGGRDYADSQFNRITQSRRQPGSIFKPIVYAAALETAYSGSTPLTAASIVTDQPTRFAFDNAAYEPRNFNDVYMGQVTMRQAITRSLNVAAVKFAEMTGYDRVTRLAVKLGLNDRIKPYPAMAIGSFEITPLEIVRAYTAFANRGLLAEITPVIRIQDDKGKRIFSAGSRRNQAITPQVAFLITSLLESVMNDGTGAGTRSRGFLLPAAGKTGTSFDGWFAGYTPDLLCIVWVGFDDNRELGLSGAESALPIWTEFMKKAVTLRPLGGESFPRPEGIMPVEIDPLTGLVATESCPQRRIEYFIAGTEPRDMCSGSLHISPGASSLPAPLQQNREGTTSALSSRRRR